MIFKTLNTITDEHKNCYINKSGLFDKDGNLISNVDFGNFFLNRIDQNYPAIIKSSNTIEIVTFIEVRGKSEYSLQDSIASVKSIINKAEVGIGVQDHGVGYSLFDFNQNMLKVNKKPLNGCEFYINVGPFEYDHLVLIAKNEQGYRDLSKLMTLSSSRLKVEDSNNEKARPWLKLDDFSKYDTNNFIVLHGYEYSFINKAIEDNKLDKLDSYINEVTSIFNKDDFYLEIQFHDDKSSDLNDHIYDLSEKYNVKTVLTNDYHMIDKDDLYALEVFQTIGMKNGEVGNKNWHTTGNNWHLHTNEEVNKWNVDNQLLDHTIEIFNKVETYNLEVSNNFMPIFNIPSEFKKDKDYFIFLAEKGLKVRYGKITPEYRERLDFEIDIISSMGFVGYFLIVADFISYGKRSYDAYDSKTVSRWKKFIKENNYSDSPIAIGPARGSVTGSLVAYAMGITEIDPIKFDLLFERFLNPERYTMPDIDTDIPDNKRQEIIHYVKDYYNEKGFDVVDSRVAGMGTFGTYKIKALLKAIVRVLYKNTEYSTYLTKFVTDDSMTFEEFLEIPEIAQLMIEDVRMQRIASVAPKLMFLISNLTQHAAGYVITPSAVTDYLPTVFVESKKTGEMEMLTAFTHVEEVGLLKMDFLGLRSMSIIDDAIQDINKQTGSKLTVASILKDAPNDLEIYKYIEKGNTSDLFQLASSGMTDVITRSLADVNDKNALKRATDGNYFSRIIAGIAMYRPGPMQYIESFISNALNPDDIDYAVDEMKDLLSGSFGLLIYQESIMALLRVMAGFTLGGADVARRAISKKDKAVLATQKDIFINGDNDKIPGGLALGHSESELNKLWGDVETFAEYGFNKSHAAGYAHITIVMAYLAYYYPSYFAVANLNHPQNKDSITNLMSTYKTRKIKTIPAEINSAEDNFTTDGNSIRFGLVGITNVAAKSKAIYDERRINGEFISIFDFLSRMARNRPEKPINKLSLEALIYAGALDEFPGSRKSKIDNILKMTSLFSVLKKESNTIFDQTDNSYFENYLSLDDNEYPVLELLEREHHYTGFYISGHPTEQFSDIIKDLPNFVSIKDLEVDTYGISTIGTITNVHKIITKRNEIMAFVTMEDSFKSTECILFPSSFSEFGRFAKEGEVVTVFGNVNDEGRLIVNSMDFANEKVISRLVDHIQINLSSDIKEATNVLNKILDVSNINNIGNLIDLGYVINGKEYRATKKIPNLSISNDVETINFIKGLIGKDNFTLIWKSY